MAKKVVIDAGHGGDDPGTIANGITEKDLTLKISQYIHNRLDSLGVENSMTRTSDVTLDPSKRPQKAQSFYGKGNDVVLISNHINAGGGDGAEVIYALRNSDRLSNIVANEFVKSGQNVRKVYQRRLPSDSSKDYYYMLRDTPNNESIIIEYGFADSKGDDVNLLKNNWQDLAEGVVRALTTYLGVPYVPPIGSNSYTVKKGDTLWTIAKTNGVTVDELKTINNLKNNSLTIGQILILPKKNSGGTNEEKNTYVVKAGDNLYALARRFNTTVSELKRLNKLTSDSLSIGQIILLPTKSSGENNTEEPNVYIVKAGDNLYAIARKYNTTEKELLKLNNLSNDLLQIGQKLKIPSKENSNEVYTVVSGDNLYAIARKFHTTVKEIEELNNLSSNNLSIGQKLLIPN